MYCKRHEIIKEVSAFIIRDHPHHDWPIMAGMWDVYRNFKNTIALSRSVIIDFIKDKWAEYNNDRMLDTFFLKDIVYPAIENECFCYDEIFGEKYKNNVAGGKMPRFDFGFIGEQFNEAEERKEGYLILKEFEEKK